MVPYDSVPGVYFTKLILRCFLSVLSTNLKNKPLLSYKVLENPFHETHHRLSRVLHQTVYVIDLYRGHIIDLQRFSLVIYGGSQCLLFYMHWTMSKGIYGRSTSAMEVSQDSTKDNTL